MVTMIIARELGLEDRYGGRIKNTRWLRSKACSICATKTAACSSSPRRCPAVFARVCVGETGRTGAASRRLSAGKSARHSPQRQRRASLSPTPCARCARSADRQHSRYPAFVVLVGGSSSILNPSWSPMRWRTTGWWPGEKYSRQRAQETR